MSNLVGLPLHQVLATVLSPEQLDDLGECSTTSLAGTNATMEAMDGAGRHWLIKRAPCYFATGEPAGCIISMIDISHIRQAESQREEALGFLSHDMRAPQAAIVALLQRCHDEDHPPRIREVFDRIDRYARRTLAMAEDFVQYARARSSSYQFEYVDLAEVMLDALDDVWPLAQEKGIVWERQLPRGPAYGRIDRSLMPRAVVNLLTNAIKYSPRGGVIACSVISRDGEWVIAVRDHGIGIAPEDQPRLFQRFGRVSEVDPLNPHGIGLGLLFVKTVLERHGGRVELDSTPGEGTEVRLRLPMLGIAVESDRTADSDAIAG
jgi:signal transduction histidine kinase